MSQPIDLTYVELRARGEDDAAREVKKAVDEMERDVDRASRAMETDLSRAFTDAADSIERSVGGISDSINESTRKNRRAVVQWGDDLIEVFDEVEDSIGGVTDALGGGGGGGGGQSLVSSLAQVGGQLRNISALVPPPIFLALAAAIPAIIALGGALADLSAIALALPAALAVLGASFATLKVAFSGFGDAVSALASGDLDKINEAMAKLAPAAQSVAREVNKLREPFAALRKEVQQAFFAPLVGDLTRLSNAVLPTLRGGMRDVASAFGELGSEILDLLGQNDIVESLGDIFESTARIVRDISPELVDFLGVLFGVIEHGLPFVEKVFEKLGGGLQSVTDFLSGSLSSGDFEKFLDDALATLGDLFDLTKSVFGLLQSVFGDAGDEGRTFIQSLTEMTDKLTAFFNSADGQEILQRLLDTLPLLVSSLEAGATVLGFLLVGYNGWLKALEAIGGAVVVAGKAVGDFFSEVWDWVQRAGSAIGGFFTSVGTFFSELGGKIQDAFNAVVDFGGRIVTWITELPGKVLAAIQALPGLLGRIFTDALNAAAYAVGFGIGTVVRFFAELPERLATGLVRILDLISNTFTTVRDRAIARATELVSSVTTFINSLPELITAGLSALVEKVRSFFLQTRDAGQSRIRELVNSVRNFFNDLPERVTGALNSFKSRVISIFTSIKNSAYNIGRDIVNGIKNGITDAIGGAIDVARNAAQRVKQGFLDALNIDSPSKVMADEVGRPIVQGVGVGIQAEEPALRAQINRMIGGTIPALAPGVPTLGAGAAAGTSITFDAGAVQVVFEGVVPTEEEARRTGDAVGSGIARTLARRNVRTLVRTT